MGPIRHCVGLTGKILCHGVRITYYAGIKPRDAAAVLFGLSSPTTFTRSLRVAKLRKPGFRVPNILY